MAWEDKELSLQKVRKLTAQAAAGEADMIVFPEMSLTGFSMDIDRIGEDPDQPESVERMGRIAGEYHIAIGFGWAALPEAGQTKGTNRFTVLDAEGKVLGEYRSCILSGMGAKPIFIRAVIVLLLSRLWDTQ